MGKLILNGVEYINNRIDGYPPLIYSTEEREIGVWTDGKPLYQKTYSIPATSIVAHDNDIQIDLTDMDTFVQASGTIKFTNGKWFVFPDSHWAGEWNIGIYNVTATSFDLAVGNYVYSNGITGNVYVTFKYTKTTDTPGSGKWSPSGLPAKHYSTTERVIGTWIDGKPLYEKVITGLSVNLTWHNQYRTEGIFSNAPADIDTLVYIDGYGPSNGNHKAHFGITVYDYGSSSWTLFSLQDGTVTTLIIQYTKTTD